MGAPAADCDITSPRPVPAETSEECAIWTISLEEIGKLKKLCAEEATPSATAPDRPNPDPRGKLVFASTCIGEGMELKIIVAASIVTWDPFILSTDSCEEDAVKVIPSDRVSPAPVDPDLRGSGERNGEKNRETCAGINVEIEDEIISNLWCKSIAVAGEKNNFSDIV